MNKEVAEKLVAGHKLELEIANVDVVRLHGHKGTISEATNATFVVTAELRLTEAGYLAMRDWGPCKKSGRPGITLLEIRNDGNVVCPLEPDIPQPALEALLRDHLEFCWELNGRASSVPRIDELDGVTDKAVLQHPWVCVLDPIGIRTQVFDLDCRIKPIRSGDADRDVEDVTIVNSGLVPYWIEIDGKVDSKQLVGTSFRVPVVVEGLDRDAYLVFAYEPRTRQYLPGETVVTPPPEAAPAQPASAAEEPELPVGSRRRTRGSSPPNNGRTPTAQ